MQIEVSNGEILDKFSILELKKRYIQDPEKRKNIQKEHEILGRYACSILPLEHPLYQKLFEVNQKLWHIEEDLRLFEQKKQFDERFVELARAVYQTNDLRADLKKQINQLTRSTLTEEKSYQPEGG